MVIPRAYCPIDPAGLAAGADRSAEIEQVLAQFRALLAVMGRSVMTQRVYVGVVRRWLHAGGAPGHLDAVVCSAWLAARRRAVSTASVNTDIKALRAFYRGQAACGQCAKGEDAKLPQLRHLPDRLVRYLTLDQVADVLAMPDISTWCGFRDHVLLRVLFETGLRSGEITRLGMGDVLPDGMVFVHRGKGGRDRYVPITQDMQALIAHWIDRRRISRPGKRAALFLSHRGKPLSQRTVWHIVDKHTRAALGRAIGIVHMVGSGRPWQGQYPHLLRASIATAWHQRGMPVTAIAELLGHSSIATTAHYVAVDLEQLRKAIACHPRSARPVD